MKKILTTGLCLALASIGGAEVIQSVNFNPARFGQYERLKVSEQANFKGGLKAKSMQVQSSGTIDLNETPSAEQGRLAYDITKLDGSLGHSHVGDDFPATPTLEFPATCFSSLESCVTATATGTLNVKFQKGAARFQAPSSYTTAPESRIKQITTGANRLRLEAVYANINGRLHVSGNEGYTYRNRDLNRNAHTPMRLAGNWIPLPSASGAPTGGTLEWQPRKTVKYASSGGGDKVVVLALKGKKSVKSCADSSYRAAHKSECCPSAAKTDTVCWTCKQEYVLEKINPCSCTPCAMMAFPSDPAIEEKMCLHVGADPCHCIKNWYVSGGSSGLGGINKKSCSISQWQSCKTTCTKNGW